MNPCEHCGAKPGRGGVVLQHKKGCKTKFIEPGLTTPSPNPVVLNGQGEPVINSGKGIVNVPGVGFFVDPTPPVAPVVRQCFTCVCCVKPWSGMNECHRYPPSGGQWARVGPGDWCKEWEQKGE